jgi:hypothetical protein
MYTLADLALARQHVGDGRRRVAMQRDRIAWLVAKGHRSEDAEILLKLLLGSLAFMERHWEEIEASIDRSGAAQISN